MKILLFCIRCGRKNLTGVWVRMSKVDAEDEYKGQAVGWRMITCAECIQKEET